MNYEKFVFYVTLIIVMLLHKHCGADDAKDLLATRKYLRTLIITAKDLDAEAISLQRQVEQAKQQTICKLKSPKCPLLRLSYELRQAEDELADAYERIRVVSKEYDLLLNKISDPETYKGGLK